MTYYDMKIYLTDMGEIPKYLFRRISIHRLNTSLHDDWLALKHLMDAVDFLYPPNWGYDNAGIYMEANAYSVFFKDCVPNLYELYTNLPSTNFFRKRIAKYVKTKGKTIEDWKPWYLQERSGNSIDT